MTCQQRLILLAAILGSSVVTLDSSAVSVALPAIRRELGGGLSAQQWASKACLLTLGSFVLIGGALGVTIASTGSSWWGRSRSVRSRWCAVAPNTGVRIGAGALQGIPGTRLVQSSLSRADLPKSRDVGGATNASNISTLGAALAVPIAARSVRGEDTTKAGAGHAMG
jgi:MFS family permease